MKEEKKKVVPLDDYNHRIHWGSTVVGTVLPSWGHSALANGWKIVEILEVA